MRLIIFVSFIFGLHQPVSGQGLIGNDTCDKNYKVVQGKLWRFNLLDNGTYLAVKSNHYSFIEFTFLSWGTRCIKYRVETTLNNQTYIVTKIISNTDAPSTRIYVAIDSTTFKKIKKNRKSLNYLTKEKVCEMLSDADLELFNSYSSFIKNHDFETEFSNFYPNLFVAWLKIKN